MFDDPTGRFQKLSAEYSRLFGVFEKAGYSLDSLNPPERAFLLVFMADSAIHSDGIYSLWFNNHGLLDTAEVVELFHAVGAHERARVIDCFVRAASHIPRETNISARSKQMKKLPRSWPDDEKLSQDYYSCGKNMYDLLVSFIARYQTAAQAGRDDGDKLSN